MTKKMKDLLVGAVIGLTFAVVLGLARNLISGDQSWSDVAWSLWIVPYMAFMWSVWRSDEPNVVRGPRDRPLSERRADGQADQDRES